MTEWRGTYSGHWEIMGDCERIMGIMGPQYFLESWKFSPATAKWTSCAKSCEGFGNCRRLHSYANLWQSGRVGPKHFVVTVNRSRLGKNGKTVGLATLKEILQQCSLIVDRHHRKIKPAGLIVQGAI